MKLVKRTAASSRIYGGVGIGSIYIHGWVFSGP